MTSWTTVVLLLGITTATHGGDTLNNDIACGDLRPDVKINPGQIQAPQYYNGSYVHHQNCHWLLQASQGHVVGLDFLLVDLSTTFPCVYSNITVYDGDTPNKDDVILQLCGYHDVTPHVFSSWHVMLVVFQTGHQGQGMGFTADFDFTSVTDIACNPSTQPAVLDWSLGGFVSPNWPNPYPPNQHCSWIIRTKVYRDLRLEFVQFHLEDSSQSYCSNDNVTIHDGSAPGDALIGVFCGDHAPEPSGITQSDMLVTFKSDSSGQFGGFQARFREYNTTAYACSESNPVEIDWSPGNIYSPDTEESTCTWRFTAAVGKVVRFDIVYFDLPDCHLCGCGSLQIFDGENEYAPSLGTYCRDGWGNFPLITGGNTAFCIYSSYSLYELAGFQIRFQSSFYDPSGTSTQTVTVGPEPTTTSTTYGSCDDITGQWKDPISGARLVLMQAPDTLITGTYSDGLDSGWFTLNGQRAHTQNTFGFTVIGQSGLSATSFTGECRGCGPDTLYTKVVTYNQDENGCTKEGSGGSPEITAIEQYFHRE